MTLALVDEKKEEAKPRNVVTAMDPVTVGPVDWLKRFILKFKN